MKNRLSGEVAYLLGIAIAIVMSFLPDSSTTTSGLGINPSTATLILVVLGLVIGLLSFRAAEPLKLLAVTIGLMIAGSFGLDVIYSFSATTSASMPLGSSITILSAPIALILCLKILIDRARMDSA